MKLIAHRGNDNHKYKENTTKALLESLNKEYIDGVELDIRLTKDKKYVIHHNTSYVVLGIDRVFISSVPLKKAINDGISSLEDFLDRVSSDKIIMIEVKNEFDKIVDDIKELLIICEKYKKLNLWLCSFCYPLVKQLKSICKLPIGLLISDLINKNKDIKPFDFISLSKNAYNDIKTEKVKMIWTINKKEQLKKEYNYVITDKAYLL